MTAASVVPTLQDPTTGNRPPGALFGASCERRAKARGQACEELKDEIGPLTDWISARKAEAVPFLVLGDFNRWMNKGDTFLASLLQAAPMSRATEGQS